MSPKLGRRAPEPEADERLDPYRRAVAQLFDGSRPVGYLLLRVDVAWTVAGRALRRRDEDPREVLDWLVAFTDQREDAITSGTIDRDELDDALDELADEEFLVDDDLFRLVWITGDEADDVWADYGWPV